jgi:hypothetical protein
VDEWIDAGTLQLTLEDHWEIATAIDRTGAGNGPSMPRMEVATNRNVA